MYTSRRVYQKVQGQKWLNGGENQVFGAIAQLGEHRLCKPEVAGSSPAGSTFVSAYRVIDYVCRHRRRL